MISTFRKIRYFLVGIPILSLHGLSTILLMASSLFILIKILPYYSKNNLSEILFLPVLVLGILFFSIFVIYKNYKKIMASRMSYYSEKKTYKNFTHYLESNNIGEVSGLMEKEFYLNYQDTKLFYKNGFIIGKFKKIYSVDLSEISTPELIKIHALKFSKVIENESETYNEYLKKRFISIAAAFHCIPIKRLYQ